MSEQFDPEAALRPAPDDVVTSTQLHKWYWSRAQLNLIARRLGVRQVGNKAELTQRIARKLDGLPDELPDEHSKRPTSATRLAPPFHPDDVVPPGQPMSRGLRYWFREHVDDSFRFDSHMRAFFRDPAGGTLTDAVELWHATRNAPAPTVSAQFEYNRFTRSFRASHPEATRDQLLEAWQRYKDTPTDRRPRA